MSNLYTITLTHEEREILLNSLLKTSANYLHKADHAEAAGEIKEAYRWREKHDEAEALRQVVLHVRPEGGAWDE